MESYASGMKRCLMLFALLMMATGICITSQAADTEPTDPSEAPVYILPIREDIMPPLTYLVRRGVKEAIASNAQCLIIDMETNGGRVDVTEEIIQLINRFEGRKITYINAKAFSAGAFISVATQEIYMSPVSVIGAAAPFLIFITTNIPFDILAASLTNFECNCRLFQLPRVETISSTHYSGRLRYIVIVSLSATY